MRDEKQNKVKANEKNLTKEQLAPTEKAEDEKTKVEEQSSDEEYDPYEGYDRDNPPPWMDEFEYIDFMMTH